LIQHEDDALEPIVHGPGYLPIHSVTHTIQTEAHGFYVSYTVLVINYAVPFPRESFVRPEVPVFYVET
jgi:hypothetical protein